MDHLNAYEGKTILVTGGAGAIGSTLTRRLGRLTPVLYALLASIPPLPTSRLDV
ncbi:MAG: hypothetical protein ACPLYD_12700 [Anaerolineae bacterium]